jgi:DNA-binding XRE family transcriptional regulator
MRKLKQEELAALAGINVCTIKKIEHNQVSPARDTCKKIVDALNKDVFHR